MKVTDSDKIKLLDFIACLEDFASGKFLLVDSKVNNILKKIGEIDVLYNLFDEVLTGYNFEKEFSHAQIKFVGKPNKFEVPEEPEKLLPLVFCLLVKIQDGSLDFSTFLRTYFDGEEGFKEFGKQVILPFKEMISTIFELPTNASVEHFVKSYEPEQKPVPSEPEPELVDEENEEGADIGKYFEDIKKLIGEILSEIDYLPKLKTEIKENAYIVLDAMETACDNQDLKMLNGLLVGFEYLAPSIKNIKFLYKELKKVLLDLYDNLV